MHRKKVLFILLNMDLNYCPQRSSKYCPVALHAVLTTRNKKAPIKVLKVM